MSGRQDTTSALLSPIRNEVITHARGTTDHPPTRNEELSSAEIGPRQISQHESDTPYHINTNVTYDVNTKSLRNVRPGILVDRGANGCIAGRDASVVTRTDRFIDLTGVDDHTVR